MYGIDQSLVLYSGLINHQFYFISFLGCIFVIGPKIIFVSFGAQLLGFLGGRLLFTQGEFGKVSFFSFSCYCSCAWYCSRSNSIFIFCFKFQFRFLLLIPISFSFLSSNFSSFSAFDFLFVYAFRFQLQFHFWFLFVDSFSFLCCNQFPVAVFVSVVNGRLNLQCCFLLRIKHSSL